MAENIKKLSVLDTVIPSNMSGGTGYDQYFIIGIEYESGKKQSVRVSYYYQDFNQVFKNLYGELAECGNPAELHEMLRAELMTVEGYRFSFLPFSDLPAEYRSSKNPAKRKIYRIRKLTPRECFRLMGVTDIDISKIQNYPLVTTDGKEFTAPDGMEEKDIKKLSISESQQYKMAGNSIVVQVLEGIFTQLFRADSDCLF